MRKIIVVILILAAFGSGGYYGWKYFNTAAEAEPPQMVSVKKTAFVHEILERGSVESAGNTDIRCEVESGGGLTIISVVAEGSIVKKGDLLVELDSSSLRENVLKQQIAVLASQSKLAQSEADLKTAELTLTEYLEGKFKEERKTIENEIFAAEEQVRTQEDLLAYYKRLLERGYVTDSKVAADIIELDKAVNAKDIAELKLKVLTKYTKEKNVTDYNAKIASCKSKVDSDKKSLELDESRLKHLESQLELCKITAPQDGQVIYFMPRWGGDEDLIKEGKKVYERQVLLRLPDVSQMQVKGLINEATVRLVKVGQKAVIRLEAFPKENFDGVVKIVNDYPEPNNWMGGTMSKEYMTTITILNPPDGIKTGLTAEAWITVNTIADALTVPVQAVLEHGNKIFAVTFNNGVWDKVSIKTGPSNSKEVVILDGLQEGDRIVLGAVNHRDKIDLPKIEKKKAEEGKTNEKEPEAKNAEKTEKRDSKPVSPPAVDASK